MSASITYLLDKASSAQIADHLLRCDADFTPALSSRVDINEYAKKIGNKARRFEAWSGGSLVGLVAAYCNDRETRLAYITSVSVQRQWAGNGIATRLIARCVAHAVASAMRQVNLEVAREDSRAIKLYEKCGFTAGELNAQFVQMSLVLKRGKEHEQRA